jgi:light-regulated signal transduction histidine kinase (bacteriophytochrome)
MDSQDGRAVLFVRDNGIGIDPAYHGQIFGVFQRLHRREDYDGTGAGLAIVKRAVEAMDGSVWLESAPDQGSTFFVALPLWEEALVATNAAA